MRKHRTRGITLALGMTAALVLIGMIAAVIVPTESSAWAARYRGDCVQSYAQCWTWCNEHHPRGWKNTSCVAACGAKNEECLKNPPTKSPKGATSTPPTGQGPRGPVSVDPNQPGGTATPGGPGSPPKKPKVGIGKGDIGVFNQPATSGGSSPIQRTQSGKKK